MCGYTGSYIKGIVNRGAGFVRKVVFIREIEISTKFGAPNNGRGAPHSTNTCQKAP
jgi:hypothetical protein